jgi:hypothetical protein
MVFSIFSAQPLTIVGVTGLISLFNYTIYDIVSQYDVTLYPQVMAWTGIWAAIFHWIVAIGNYCDYMGYITDFSSETFGMYVGIIYMSRLFPPRIVTRLTPCTVKGVEELVNEFSVASPAAGFLSCLIAIMYFGSVYGLAKLGSSVIWRPWFRTILADYAYVFPTLFWVGFSHIPGRIRNTDITYVPTTKAFQPTQARNWVIDFWNLDVGWVFVSLPFGFLTMLLFYYDHVRNRPLSGLLFTAKLNTECKQFDSPSPPISSQETRRISLGLLSPRLHHLCGRCDRAPNAQRSRPPSTRTHRFPDKLRNASGGDQNEGSRYHGNKKTCSGSNGSGRTTSLAFHHGDGALGDYDWAVTRGAAYYASCRVCGRVLRRWCKFIFDLLYIPYYLLIDPIVGLHRNKRHPPEAHLPPIRKTLHPARQPPSRRPASQDHPLHRPSDPRRRCHSSHFADHCRNRISCSHHRTDTAANVLDAAVAQCEGVECIGCSDGE